MTVRQRSTPSQSVRLLVLFGLLAAGPAVAEEDAKTAAADASPKDAPRTEGCEGQTSWVASIAMSPDGRLLAAGGGSTLLIHPGELSLWSTATLKETHRLPEPHKSAVWAVAFSADGKLLASASSDKRIKLWDLDADGKAKERAAMEGHTNWVTDLAFSPDGKLVASASEDATVRLWDVEKAAEAVLKGQTAGVLKGHTGTVRAVAFSADGATLATASYDGTVRLWSLETASETASFPAHEEGAWDVALSRDAKTVYSAGADGLVKVWSEGPADGLKGAFGWRVERALKGHRNWVASLALSPDGTRLASGGFDRQAIVWNLARGEAEARIEDAGATVWSVLFAADGGSVYVATGAHVRDEKPAATLERWLLSPRATEVAGGAAGGPFAAQVSWVTSIAISADGKLLATGGGSRLLIRPGEARVWDLSGGAKPLVELVQAHRTTVWGVDFSRDGRLLATGGHDGVVKVWELDPAVEGGAREKHVLQGHANWVTDVAFAPSGKLLASASEDGTVKLWDLDAGKESATLSGHGATVRAVAFSPDGLLLASASQDKTVRLWDGAGGAAKATLEGHADAVWDVAFSPDGKRLATCGADRVIKIWDLTRVDGDPKGSVEAKAVATLQGHKNWVTSIAFSPDGAVLASGGYDRRVLLWDLATHASYAALEDIPASVWSVAFTPDGARIAAGIGDQAEGGPTLRLWPAPPRAGKAGG